VQQKTDRLMSGTNDRIGSRAEYGTIQRAAASKSILLGARGIETTLHNFAQTKAKGSL